MSAAQQETSNQQLSEMLNKYNDSITNALQQLYINIVVTDANSPEVKRQENQKMQDQLLFEEELLACLRIKQEIELALLTLLKKQNEEQSDEERKHHEYLAALAYEEEEEEMEALAKQQLLLSENERQHLEIMKREMEQVMKELNDRIQENQTFINYVTNKLKETKDEFIGSYVKNMETQLLKNLDHDDEGNIQFKMGEHTASIHVDKITDVLKQAAEEEYRKVANTNQVADNDAIAKNINKRMASLFGEHFAKHPEAARFAPQAIENAAKNVARVVLDNGVPALKKALDLDCVGRQDLEYALSKHKVLVASKQSAGMVHESTQKPDISHTTYEKIKQNASQALSQAASHTKSNGAESTQQEYRKFGKFEALAKRLAAQQAAQANNRPTLAEKAENCAQLRKS